jgi:hypothetical protein
MKIFSRAMHRAQGTSGSRRQKVHSERAADGIFDL